MTEADARHRDEETEALKDRKEERKEREIYQVRHSEA